MFRLQVQSKPIQMGPVGKNTLPQAIPCHLRLATNTNVQCLTIRGCWPSHEQSKAYRTIQQGQVNK